MVDLQSERSTNGHLVLTCVLFPQQELDETSRFIGNVVVLVLYVLYVLSYVI